MKVDKKIIIEVDSSDVENFKSAIKKINSSPQKIGLNDKDSLTPDEISIIKKLNDCL